MRDGLPEILRCPGCGADGTFAPEVRERSEREITEAVLTCRACGRRADVHRGIVDLLGAPPEHVRREAAGLERFAEFMRNEGWDRERVLALPHDELGYWKEQARAFDAMLTRLEPRPGERLLDVGANTCWAANLLAQRGLDVIALDISTVELQGLGTAEWFFAAGDVFFERVLATMQRTGIATGSLDYVFCSQVLHHNDPDELLTTLRELHRVLTPTGTLIVLSEPLRFLNDLRRDHGEEVAEFEGHEHIYFAWQYRRAVRRAGFDIEVVPPQWPTFGDEPLQGGGARVAIQERLRRSRTGRRLLLAKAQVLGPEHTLGMLCQKRHYPS